MANADINAIIEDFILRTERGEPFDEVRCLRDHPELAEELREFFQLHQSARTAFEVSSLNVARPRTSSPPKTLPLSDRSAWSWNRVADAEFPLSFGPYDLIEEINRGGMGIVYRATHRDLGRTVALKVLRAGEMATPEEIRRFRTEVLASTALQHPHIIPTFDAGTEHGLFYLTMAFIEGEDLESIIRRGPIDPLQAGQWLLKITDAVDYAHQQKIIHRDIKPSNILLDGSGEPFLADFGLAHRMSADEGLTVTGQLLGTPAYMPPEQASGKARNLSPSIDIYSLGAVLYACLTGQPPFSGLTPFEVLLQVVDRQPPAPRQLNKRCPITLESICLKAMDKNPEQRYSTARELANDLRRFIRGEPIDFPKPTFTRRLTTWWRREPILLSHLAALTTVSIVVLISHLLARDERSAPIFAVKFSLLISWCGLCGFLQRLSRYVRYRSWVHLVWAASDVIIYTALMYMADAPRGLLLVGYPMMIGASGLFYRVRFVVFMTVVCILSVLLLSLTVTDPVNERVDFLIIYVIGLLVLGSCVMTMIRRIRGLSRFCGASNEGEG